MKNKKKGGFSKGVSPNPEGRPKGCLNKSTNEYLKLKSMAANDYARVYSLLMDKIEAGEGWAYNIYFKELLPKKIKEETILVEWTDGPIEEQLEALLKGYKSFKELTPESILAAIKVIGDIRDKKSSEEKPVSIFTSGRELLSQLEEVIKHKEQEQISD